MPEVTKLPNETVPRSEEDLLYSTLLALGGGADGVTKLPSSMTPRSKQDLLYSIMLAAQAIDGGGSGLAIASQAEALAGTDNTKLMTPLRVAQAIAELSSGGSNKADLVNGKVPASQLPGIALITFLGAVANEAEMLALEGEPGDYCFREDTHLAYILADEDATQAGSWLSVVTPGAIGVASVNDMVGAVVIGADDVGAVPSESYVTDQVAAVYQVQILQAGDDTLDGVYFDLPSPEGLQRFWFNRDGGQSAPATPSGGAVVAVVITGGMDATAVASAVAGSTGSAFSGSASGVQVTLTAVTAGTTTGSLSSTDSGKVSVSTQTAGSQTNGTRIAEIDGSQLINMSTLILTVLQEAIDGDGYIVLPDGRKIAVVDA